MSPTRSGRASLIPTVKAYSLSKVNDPRDKVLKRKTQNNEVVTLFERPVRGSKLKVSGQISKAVAKNVKSVKIVKSKTKMGAGKNSAKDRFEKMDLPSDLNSKKEVLNIKDFIP